MNADVSGPETAMTIEWDVEIPTSAGGFVRADVFRPAGPGKYPVIMTHGVYGKGLPASRLFNNMVAHMNAHPLMAKERGANADLADTTVENVVESRVEHIADDDYRVWEVVDPSIWVPAGYACVRVDSRGSGSSEGFLDPLSLGEIDDYFDCIEWAGSRDWSNGKVGLNGKSYYAMTQWLVAERNPRHLAAMCAWHGLSDWYRDATRHGGIIYRFWEDFWYPALALPVQYGNGASTNPHSGLPVTGPAEYDSETLRANRTDVGDDIRRHPTIDDYYQARTPDLSKIDIPVLAAADWSDQDLHLRGTIRGFTRVTGPDKWLEIHAGGSFDDPDAVRLQMRFFDHYLKDDAQDDWDQQPPVQLTLRRADRSTYRLDTTTWPLPGTTWTPQYMDFRSDVFAAEVPDNESSRSYDSTSGEGVQLTGAHLEQETTLVGPVSARLFLSSSTRDADLFLTLNALDPEGRIVELGDHRTGLTPASLGWQRASLRATDAERSTPGVPAHRFDTAEPLEPGEIVAVEVELCPTSLVLPAGSRIMLTVRGNGSGHNDPADRPEAVFHNEVTLHAGPEHPSHLLLPVVSL